MQSNRLQLNTSNTELLWCATKRRQVKLPCTPLRVGPHLVNPTSSVRDLGIHIDADLSGRTQVLIEPLMRRVLLLYDSCGQFVGACHWLPINLSSCRWYLVGWTMATQRCLAFPTTSIVVYSPASTRRQGLYSDCGGRTM